MALTVEVSKVSVDTKEDKVWFIVFNLRCLAGATEVINKDFFMRYEPGDDVEQSVREILVEMQNEIDKRNKEIQLYTTAKLNTAVTWLQNNLVG